MKKGNVLMLLAVIAAMVMLACDRDKTLPLEPYITYKQACDVWGAEYNPEQEPKIRYTGRTLRWAAWQNQAGEDWRLIYIHGFSLNQMNEKLKKDKGWKPLPYTWWRNKHFADSTFFNDYYLINFKPKFFNQTWTQQEENVKKLEDQSRTPISVFTESVLSIYMHSRERISSLWSHRGDVSFLSGHNSLHVSLSTNRDAYRPYWLFISWDSDDFRHLEFGVFVFRNFDF